MLTYSTIEVQYLLDRQCAPRSLRLRALRTWYRLVQVQLSLARNVVYPPRSDLYDIHRVSFVL